MAAVGARVVLWWLMLRVRHVILLVVGAVAVSSVAAIVPQAGIGRVPIATAAAAATMLLVVVVVLVLMVVVRVVVRRGGVLVVFVVLRHRTTVVSRGGIVAAVPRVVVWVVGRAVAAAVRGPPEGVSHLKRRTTFTTDGYGRHATRARNM